MKQCPACNRMFTDDTLVYCLDDGSRLSAPYDSEATQVINPTLPANVPPTEAYRPPRATAPPTLHLPAAAPPTRQGFSPTVIYILIAVLALAVGAGAMFLLRPGVNEVTHSPNTNNTSKTESRDNGGDKPPTNTQATPSSSVRPSPSPSPSLSPLPSPQPTVVARPTGVPGSYPEGSTRYLSGNELAAKSCFDLRVMRNEIFARHGYVFKTDDMRAYFSRQSWYRASSTDVAGALSAIEKSNAQLIKQYESGKNCN